MKSSFISEAVVDRSQLYRIFTIEFESRPAKMATNHSGILNGSDVTTTPASIHIPSHEIATPILEIFFAIDVIFIVVALVGNAFIIYVCVYNKVLYRPSIIFTISIAVGHLLLAIFVLPIFITSHFPKEHLTMWSCRFLVYLGKVSQNISMASLLPLAVDNFRRYTLRHKSRLTFRGAWVQTTIVWVWSFVYALWHPVMFQVVSKIHVEENGDQWSVQMCDIPVANEIVHKYYVIVDSAIMYFIPVPIFVFCYSLVLYWIWARLEPPMTKSEAKQRIMGTKSFIIFMLTFVFCNIGNQILAYYVHWGPGYFRSIHVMTALANLAGYSLSWMNVLMLLLFNSEFRIALFRPANKKSTKPPVMIAHIGGTLDRNDGGRLSKTGRGTVAPIPPDVYGDNDSRQFCQTSPTAVTNM